MKHTRNPYQLTLPHRTFSAYDVDVDGEGFRGALVVLRHFTDTPAGLWASVSMVDGRLRVDIRGVAFSAEARGNWRSRVKVPAVFFAHLLAFPPEGNWLPILIEHDRLVVGQHSVEIDRPWNRAPGQRGSRRPVFHQESLFALEPRHHTAALFQPLTRMEYEAQVRLRQAFAALAPLGVRASQLVQMMDRVTGGAPEAGSP